MEEVTSKLVQELRNTAPEWNYVNLRSFARRLNRALSLPHIQREYDFVTRAFWDLKRWEILSKYSSNRLPAPIKPLEGQQFVLPMQVDSTDWRWGIQGRHPKYFDYTCSQACHWLTQANYLLACQLFPEVDWDVLTGKYHTSVVNIENKLLFDLNYVAMGVAAWDAVEMFVRSADDEYESLLIITDGTYRCNELSMTGVAMRFWKEVDAMPGTAEEKLQKINKAREMTSLQLDHSITTNERLALAQPIAELQLYEESLW